MTGSNTRTDDGLRWHVSSSTMGKINAKNFCYFHVEQIKKNEQQEQQQQMCMKKQEVVMTRADGCGKCAMPNDYVRNT